MAKKYTISDGKLVLTLEEAEEGGFVVTSPLDPELITEGETVSECFANARDASRALRSARVELIGSMAGKIQVHGDLFGTGQNRD